MSDVKQKIFDILGKRQLMNLATLTEDGKPWVRTVMGQGDKDLTVRFITYISSRKVAHIRNNPEVHIACGVDKLETTESYLQVQGKAEITRDKDVRHAVWSKELENYFDGPDDPEYCVCIVHPYRIEFQTMSKDQPEIWEP